MFTIFIGNFYSRKYFIYISVEGDILVCAVNPIMYQNQIDKFPQIQQDYEGVKNGVNNIVDKDNKLPSIFDIIPTFRRVERIPDKVEHSDFVPATGLVALAVLNVCSRNRAGCTSRP